MLVQANVHTDTFNDLEIARSVLKYPQMRIAETYGKNHACHNGVHGRIIAQKNQSINIVL